MYEGDADPYLYPGTHTLRNRLGIQDAAQLEATEYELSAIRAHQGLPSGSLDYAHYRAIHRHLFQDIYDWAGEVRTINIAKGGSPFCRVEFVDGQMTKLFDRLRTERRLAKLDFLTFARKAAHYLVELNAIHPFREGNGRTQHAFLGLLMEMAGHPRDLSKVDPESLLQAAIDGFNGNEQPMIDVITSLPSRAE